MFGKRIATVIALLIFILPALVLADAVSDAEKLIKNRKFDDAISMLQEKIEKDKSYAELRYLLGQAYYLKGDLEQAEAAFDACLDLKRKHEMARYYRALLLIEKEEWQDARRILAEGSEKSKKNKSWFYNGLGLYHEAREEWNDADLNFRLAIIEDPENAEFQRHLADLSYEQGFYGPAAEGYQNVIAKDTTDVVALFKLGKSLFYQKLFVEALSSLSRAIALDSGYIEAYKVSGDIFMLAALSSANGQAAQESQEQFSNAAWMFQRYLELGGEETEQISYRLGQAYFSLSVYEQAVEKLNRAIELGSEKSAAYNLKAKSYFRLRQYDNAFAAYREYEDKVSGGDPDFQWDADDFEFFKERALTLYQLYQEGRAEGNADSTYLEKAIPDYVKAIELKPEDPLVPQLYVQLGLSHYYLGQYLEAIPWFEKKIEIDPDVYNTYLNMAYCYLKMGDHETAVAKMIKVTELNPEYCLAYKTVANTYLVSLKDKASASEWYLKWAECDSVTYEPYKWLGYIAISAKPPKKGPAIDRLLKAVNKMNTADVDLCSEIDVIVWLAQAYNMYDDSDKEDEALRWARRGLRCDPNNKELKQIVEDLE